MKKRTLGKTGFEISEIALGTWQVGGKWGSPFRHDNADKILNTAIDHGINFIDTADVYGDGESERAVGRVVRSRSERIYVATKCGRRFQPHIDVSYQAEGLRKFVEDSLQRSGLETLDLIQLHCPPTETYDRPEIFDLFKDLKKEGKIQHLGVSVERVEEALKAIEYDNVTTIQIIFNIFRQRPAEDLFAAAKRHNIGLIARVPLASGLLTGKFSSQSSFDPDDHRFFNRNGEAFDKGETFSGVDYKTGLRAVDSLKDLLGADVSMAEMALKWILMFEEISCVIPGASRPEQVLANIEASSASALSQKQMNGIKKIYDEMIWPIIEKEKW
jgi:aryl-alcohol dehydrogenase-like predicted oxidoreductase